MKRLQFFAVCAILFGIVAADSRSGSEETREILENSGSDEQVLPETSKVRVARYVPDGCPPFTAPTEGEMVYMRRLQAENRRLREMLARVNPQAYGPARPSEEARRQHAMRIERERQARLDERRGMIDEAGRPATGSEGRRRH